MRALWCLAAVLAGAVPAFGQVRADANAPTIQATGVPARRGFTVFANLGAGFQHDAGLSDSASGVGGINLGIGGFVNERIAVLARFSGTDVDYGYLTQTSGMAGGSIQFWVTNRFTLEGGIGSGYWTTEFESEHGLAVLAGAGVIVFHRGRHNLTVGAEYTPVFAESGTVHNIGVTFGYQYHR